MLLQSSDIPPSIPELEELLNTIPDIPENQKQKEILSALIKKMKYREQRAIHDRLQKLLFDGEFDGHLLEPLKEQVVKTIESLKFSFDS